MKNEKNKGNTFEKTFWERRALRVGDMPALLKNKNNEGKAVEKNEVLKHNSKRKKENQKIKS